VQECLVILSKRLQSNLYSVLMLTKTQKVGCLLAIFTNERHNDNVVLMVDRLRTWDASAKKPM